MVSIHHQPQVNLGVANLFDGRKLHCLDLSGPRGRTTPILAGIAEARTATLGAVGLAVAVGEPNPSL